MSLAERPPAQAPQSVEFSVFVYREDELFLAHCLECDIAAQGATRAEAEANLTDALVAMIRYAVERGDLRPLACPAPKDLWERFWAARSRAPPGRSARGAGG